MQSGQRAQELLKQADCELVFPGKPGPFQESNLPTLLRGADAVLAGLDRYSAAVLATPEAASLKVIARWGVGYDRVDLSAATANGIVVTYTPGLLDEAVADYTFALLLSVARRIPESHEAVLRNDWRRFIGSDVAGKTLGLIGCGRIGRAVARRAAGFNMRILASAPRPAFEARKLGVEFVPLEKLLAQSDFVSLHAALRPDNHGLIGEPQLRQMKPTAFLINTARGAMVDETALALALREGWIAGAALDVFVTEPPPADCPLRSAPNVLFSPHQASFGRDTGERVSTAAAQDILDVLSGRRPQNVLNSEVFESPALRAKVGTG
jgi:lactate dehydrogenase-like 2-hydroxyacid dehydrogenase